MTQEHPSSFELEAFSVGEAEPHVQSHVDDCEVCRGYLARLSEAQRSFLSDEPSEGFVRRPHIAAALAAPAEAPRTPRSTAWGWLGGFLAAATVAVFMLSPSSEREDAPTVERIRLKGASAVEVVRLRGDQQEIGSGQLRIRPGDQLRLRVRMAEPKRVSAGLLEPNGDWTPLLEDQELAIGLHWLHADALVVRPELSRATVLVGAPDAVRAARAGAQTSEVMRCELVSTSSSSR